MRLIDIYKDIQRKGVCIVPLGLHFDRSVSRDEAKSTTYCNNICNTLDGS